MTLHDFAIRRRLRRLFRFLATESLGHTYLGRRSQKETRIETRIDSVKSIN